MCAVRYRLCRIPAVLCVGPRQASTIAKVEAAYGQITVLCASKDTATAASALVAATSAYVVITSALREAKRVQQE